MSVYEYLIYKVSQGRAQGYFRVWTLPWHEAGLALLRVVSSHRPSLQAWSQRMPSAYFSERGRQPSLKLTNPLRFAMFASPDPCHQLSRILIG